MKYSFIVLMANLDLNKFMEKCDLKPNGKWYVNPYKISIETDTEVNADYFENLMNKSKSSYPDYYIPGIIFENKLYCDEGVKNISDGYKEYFTI